MTSLSFDSGNIVYTRNGVNSTIIPSANVDCTVTLPNGSGTLIYNTSITGTSDQIDANSSGTAVILSTPSTFIAPGSITSTGSLSAGTNLTVGTLYSDGTTVDIKAAGSDQRSATELFTSYNIVVDVDKDTGVVLPNKIVPGTKIIVVNVGAFPLFIYPAPGSIIDALRTDEPITLEVSAAVTLEAATTTQW